MAVAFGGCRFGMVQVVCVCVAGDTEKHTVSIESIRGVDPDMADVLHCTIVLLRNVLPILELNHLSSPSFVFCFLLILFL